MEADAPIQKLAGFFTELPQVEAVVLGGSRASGRTDDASDVDLYVFTTADIPVETRRNIVQQLGGASIANLEMGFFDDAWTDAKTEVEFDVDVLQQGMV